MNILAIDPGSHKCGFAVLDKDANIIKHEIIEIKDTITVETRLIASLQNIINEYHINTVVLGDGTHSKEIKELITVETRLIASLQNINIITADEKNSTEAGKKLYFKYNPPKGFWRFIPIGLQAPSVPYDDYAAAAIGMKYLRGIRD